MTIVGIETRKDNKVNILVFDPMFKTAPAVDRILTKGTIRDYNEKLWRMLLIPYRRNASDLKGYKMFELLL